MNCFKWIGFSTLWLFIWGCSNEIVEETTQSTLQLTRSTVTTWKSNGSSASFTTPSFTPAANTLLVIAANYKGTSSLTMGTMTISSNPTLTWTKRVEQTTAPSNYEVSNAIFTAPIGFSPKPMTVTVSIVPASTAIVQWYVHAETFIGYDTTNPIGATGSFMADNSSGKGCSPIWFYSLSAPPASTSKILAELYLYQNALSVVPADGFTELDETVCNGGVVQIQVTSDGSLPNQSVVYAAAASNNNVGVAVEIRAANVCTPESDLSFCSRLGKNCGSLSGIDNCGVARTVASCGACTSPQTCGGGGTPNVCGYISSPNIGMLILVPGGTFQRDATANNTSTVSAFHMSQYEIAQGQFTAVTGLANPSYFNSGTNGPVEEVSWYHALVFCNRLSMLEGLLPVYTISGSTDPASWGAVPTTSNATWNAVLANWSANGYRLPTEAEWQWAAMGATDSRNKTFAGSMGINAVVDYAWTSENSNNTTHTVGTKMPNELGLYDMSGNVWEWCWDWYGTYPTGAVMDYKGAASGTSRVARGGSWSNSASYATVAFRISLGPVTQGSNMGFRVVRRP